MRIFGKKTAYTTIKLFKILTFEKFCDNMSKNFSKGGCFDEL